MENLPIDTKSLPSRIFHSETEDKIYVGEPGNYKEIELELTADNIDYDNTASGLLAETVQEAVDELAGHVTELYETKEDRVSVVPIAANTTITATHHGKILLITADVVVTFPTGLGAGFTGCAFRVATGGKMTPAFGSGATGNDFFADYNPGESLYVFKESNSTNVFYAV